MEFNVKYRKIEAPCVSCKIKDTPYVLIGYAHSDAEQVFPAVKKLYESGLNIWFDDGIEVDKKYNRILANAIDECDVFLLFLTDNCIHNKTVMDKMFEYAEGMKKNIIICKLNLGISLPHEILMKISGLPCIDESALENYLLNLLYSNPAQRPFKRKSKPVKINLSIDAESDLDDFIYEKNSEGIMLTKYKGTKDDVIIPRSHKGDPVVKIRSAFEYCKMLRTVSIPGNITNIEDGAFKNCYELASVIISEGTVTIGNDAFANCEALSLIIIPDSVNEIKSNAFKSCCSLSTITIPPSVKKIAGNAFNDCKALTIICEKDSEAYRYAHKNHIPIIPIEKGELFNGIPTDRKLITDNSFEANQSVLEFPGYKYILDSKNNVILTKYTGSDENVKVPRTLPNDSTKKVVAISDLAFKGCKMKTVVIPNGIQKIGLSAFSECKSLISVTLPNSLTLIGDKAFKDCSKLTTIKIPKGINNVEIGRYTFENCDCLDSVILPDGVSIIGEGAFYNCKSLKTLTIRGDKITFGKRIFSYCNALTIYCPSCSDAKGYAEKNGIPVKASTFFNYLKQLLYNRSSNIK